jgi:hypothetical protein
VNGRELKRGNTASNRPGDDLARDFQQHATEQHGERLSWLRIELGEWTLCEVIIACVGWALQVY